VSQDPLSKQNTLHYQKPLQNGLWLKNILEELFNKKFKINLYGDNKASLYSAENFAIGKRLRHIRVSYHFFKEHVKNNNVILQHIKSEDNLADVLTKDVNGNKMLFFANKILRKSCLGGNVKIFTFYFIFLYY